MGGFMTMKFKIGAAVIAGLVAFGASTAVAQEEEDNTGWSGELSLSGAAQTGTQDTLSGTLDAGVERTWEKDKAGVRFTGSYGTSRRLGDDTKQTTQDSQTLRVDWRRQLHNRFFWESRASVGRDATQNRKIRTLANTGPGYRLWEGEDAPKKHFDLSSGIGYRYEVYDGNSNEGGNNTDRDQFVDLALGFEYKNLFFEDKIEYTHTGAAAVPGNDPKAYLLRTEVILGVPLTSTWSFRTSFLLEYTAEVPDDVNETLTRTTVGLEYKF